MVSLRLITLKDILSIYLGVVVFYLEVLISVKNIEYKQRESESGHLVSIEQMKILTEANVCRDRFADSINCKQPDQLLVPTRKSRASLNLTSDNDGKHYSCILITTIGNKN